MDILSLLMADHKKVSDMLEEAQKCESGDRRLSKLANEISQALTVHATLEEKLFYPELRDRSEDSEERVDVFEAFTEHDVVKHLIALLSSGRKQDEQFKAELQVLGETVKHHVKEEESTIFALARELMDPEELGDLGERAESAKGRLMARSAAPKSRGGYRKSPAPKKKSAGKKSAARKTALKKRRR